MIARGFGGWFVAPLLLSLLAVGSCTQPALPRPEGRPVTPSVTPMTLDSVVAAARADAARRTGIAPDALVLVEAQAVTWSDGSLGCPLPDRMYTQALVPGFRVRLRGPAGLLDYHASVGGALVLCPAGRSVEPGRSTAI